MEDLNEIERDVEVGKANETALEDKELKALVGGDSEENELTIESVKELLEGMEGEEGVAQQEAAETKGMRSLVNADYDSDIEEDKDDMQRTPKTSGRPPPLCQKRHGSSSSGE